MVDVKTVVDSCGFNSLEKEWDDVFNNAVESNPFLSFQWMQAWWEVYGKGTLYIITCRDSESGILVGILPLFRYTTGTLLRTTFLQFLASDYVSSDFLDCLVRKGWGDKVFPACLTILQNNCSEWDILQFQAVDAKASFCDFLTKTNVFRLQIEQDPEQCCPFLALPSSWEGLMTKLSSKMRQRVRYYRRSLEKDREVELEQIDETTDLDDVLKDLVSLRLDRLEQKGLSTRKVTEKYKRFHRRLFREFLKNKMLRLYFLKVEQKRVAFLYMYAGGRNAYFYQTGFERSWRKQSVGFVLLCMVIEKSIDDGFRIFEFLRGREDYKYKWSISGERQLVDIVLTNKSVSANVWKIKNIFYASLKKVIRKVIKR